MSVDLSERFLDRLRPFVHEHVIRRTRLERVLGTLTVPVEEARPVVERLLKQAGIAISEDAAAAGRQQHESEPAHDLERVDRRTALSAARLRLIKDRSVKNPAKVLLTAEEEVGLAILIRGRRDLPLEQGGFGKLEGEARRAAECLLLHNQGLVWSFARKFAPPGMSQDDLYQHGVMGLIRAVELFDPAKGFKFSTYAMNWVRQSITRGIANESRMIRIPVHMVERVNKVWATRTRLTVDGVPPTVHQLALACEVDDDDILECLAIGPNHILSLDTPVGPEGESTLGDMLDHADPDDSPEKELVVEMMRREIRLVLGKLDAREAGVIALRFGLDDDEPRTLEEIGEVYNVTRERIRQIEGKTMTKLRHPDLCQRLLDYLD